MKIPAVFAAWVLASNISSAQTPQWNVELTPTLSPLPIGMCGAVHLKITDPATRDVPRNPKGYRITMADFDMSVNGGTSASGQYIDSSHFVVCGCQSGTAGTSATVIARYPAQSLAASSRVPGVSIQQSATFALAPPKGSTNPSACLSFASGAAGAAASGNSNGAAGGGAAGAAVSGGSGAAGGGAAGGGAAGQGGPAASGSSGAAGAAASGNSNGAAGGGAAGGGAAGQGGPAASGSSGAAGAAASGNSNGAAGGGAAGAAVSGGSGAAGGGAAGGGAAGQGGPAASGSSGAAGAAASGNSNGAAGGGAAGAAVSGGSGAAGGGAAGGGAAGQGGPAASGSSGAAGAGTLRGSGAAGVPATPATAAPAPAMVAVNPSGFTATQSAPGEVMLSWNPVAAAQFYVAFGPGLSPGGQRVDQGAGTAFPQGTSKISLPASNVPGGMQEWAVASYYPNNVSTPGSAFSRVSLNVSVHTLTAATGLAGLVGAAVAPGVPGAPQTEDSRGALSLGSLNSGPTSLTAQIAAGLPPPTTAPPSNSTATPATPPTSSTPPPVAAPATGRYLVTITSLRAYQMSMDDMLSRDGMGDEVYVAAYVRNYDRRSNQLAAAETRISAVHGDVTKGWGQRLQAGTKSGTGGIQDGDMIPDGGFIATRMVPAQNSTFPLRIFEGTLVDGVDTLLISPSIWEQDDTNQYFLQWQQNQATLNQSLWAKQGVHDEIAQKTFKPLKFGMSAHDSLTGATSAVHFFTDAMIMFGGGGVPIIGLIKASADRPLGLHENGRDQTALPNHVIVLTREIIEAALTRPALGPIPSPVANGFTGYGLLSTPAVAKVGVIATKPGIMVIQFEDRNVSGTLAFPERPAIYQMYLQVERIP